MAEPYIPIYRRNGNKVLKEWDDLFDDGAGHVGLASYVLFADKSGTEHKMMKWIKWKECTDENVSAEANFVEPKQTQRRGRK